MIRSASALIALTAFGVVACSETTAVVEAPGNYSLIRLAGRPLPTTLSQGSCAWKVTDGSLVVSADSLWQVELDGLLDCPPDTVKPYPFGQVYFGTYRQSGRLLLLTVIGDVAIHTTGQLTSREAIINIEPPLDPLTFIREP